MSRAGRRGQPEPFGGREGILLAGILLVAFTSRVLWALVGGSDVRATFVYDATLYDHLARQLAKGRGYVNFLGEPTAFLPPGYPAVLAVVYAVFGTSLVAAWVANAALATLTCLLVYLTASDLFTRHVGLVAAAIISVFPGDILRSGITMSEATFGCFFAAVVYLFVRWSAGPRQNGFSRWFLFGLLLGATTLVRGVTLPFVAVPAVIWLIRDGARQSTIRTCLATLGLAVVVLPWTMRNQVVMRYPAVVSTDASDAFFNAHNPLAFGNESMDMFEFGEREWPWVRSLPLQEREVGRAKAELSFSIRYVMAHPWSEIALIPRRIFYLYAGDHYPLGERTSSRGGLHRAFVGFADAYFFLVLLLALIGIPQSVKPAGPQLILPFTLVYFTLIHGILFFGAPRYHAPLAPVLSILAALAITRQPVAQRAFHAGGRFSRNARGPSA